jgi:hypothetical protein
MPGWLRVLDLPRVISCANCGQKGRAISFRGGRSDTTSWSDRLAELSSSSVSAQQIKGRFKDCLRDRLTHSITLRAHPVSTLLGHECRVRERITPNGIKTSTAEYAFDFFIYATGFDAVLELQPVDAPEVYLGVLVEGFPNR